MIEKINSFFINSINVLNESKKQSNDLKKIIINQDFFDFNFNPNFNCENKSQYLIEKLDLISSVNNPVLYWFEFDTLKVDKSEIKESFLQYKNRLGNKYENPEYRYTSSITKKIYEVENILYVGKVEKGFYHRVKTHLGYATSPKTAGMQLFHWYDIEKFGDLTLNYIEFDIKMIYLIATLEKIIAKELKPLIGRY